MKRSKFSVNIAAIVLSLIFFCQNSYAATASYDQEVIAGGQRAMTSRVWIKDEKMRMETSMGKRKGVILIREDGTYNYDPDRNMVIKMPNFGAMEGGSPNYVKDPADYMGYLKSVGAVKTGSGDIDGRPCDIYKYTESSHGMDVSATVWVWKKHPFPLKMIMENPFGNSEVYFRNVRINEPIPESMFELPKNARVMDVTKQFR